MNMLFEELGFFSVVLVTYSSCDNKKETPQEIALHGFLYSILLKSARTHIDFTLPSTNEMACIEILKYCTEARLLT